MKKISTVFLAIFAASILLIAGCGGSSPAPAPAKPAVPASSGTAIKAIKDRGILKVGVKVDVPKFGYKDPGSGKIEGMEIDLSKAIAKKILGDENKLSVEGVNPKTRGPLLDSGAIDLVIATFTVTPERKQTYDFSDPYFVDGVGLLVKKDSGIKSIKDLNGKTVGVAQSATGKKALQEAADKAGVKVTFLEFGTYPEIKTALDAKRVDVFSGDTAILFGYVEATTVVLADRFSPQQYAVASKKGNNDLAKLVNDTIAEMKKSGELDKLFKKWGITDK